MAPKARWPVFPVFLVSALLAGGLRAEAQVLPSEPLTFGTGWLTIGGDVSATASCASVAGNSSHCTNDTGFFNYTDYQHSTLRMLIVGITTEVKAGDRLSVLAEIRSENGGLPNPYALYVRVRPWPTHGFDIQAGRVPPTFGAFSRRYYPYDNLLIGYPLAYQYLTSLRPDALPANADELLLMRGRGWLSRFSVGNPVQDNGMPLVHAFRWDTGVQVHAANQRAEATVALTTGTLANPRVGDDNSGRQVAGRLVFRPLMGLVAGGSFARGPFVTNEALRMGGVDADSSEFTQTAWGADAEYSRGYYLVRFEAIVSDWRLPLVRTPTIDLPLRAVSTSIEGRYKISPGLYVAARSDRLTFSEVSGALRADGWDAPVTRLEVGGGYSLQRNITLKLAFQHNTRKTARAATANAGAMQLVYWF
jgi:hypothetical protein